MYHFIRECIMKKEVELVHVKTQDQVANIFTKSLKFEDFRRLRARFRVQNFLIMKGCCKMKSCQLLWIKEQLLCIKRQLLYIKEQQRSPNSNCPDEVSAKHPAPAVRGGIPESPSFNVDPLNDILLRLNNHKMRMDTLMQQLNKRLYTQLLGLRFELMKRKPNLQL
ncbi:hypothetical protein CR513_46778, partial [Mucuna pruriens]